MSNCISWHDWGWSPFVFYELLLLSVFQNVSVSVHVSLFVCIDPHPQDNIQKGCVRSSQVWPGFLSFFCQCTHDSHLRGAVLLTRRRKEPKHSREYLTVSPCILAQKPHSIRPSGSRGKGEETGKCGLFLSVFRGTSSLCLTEKTVVISGVTASSQSRALGPT